MFLWDRTFVFAGWNMKRFAHRENQLPLLNAMLVLKYQLHHFDGGVSSLPSPCSLIPDLGPLGTLPKAIVDWLDPFRSGLSGGERFP